MPDSVMYNDISKCCLDEEVEEFQQNLICNCVALQDCSLQFLSIERFRNLKC